MRIFMEIYFPDQVPKLDKVLQDHLNGTGLSLRTDIDIDNDPSHISELGDLRYNTKYHIMETFLGNENWVEVSMG